MKIIDTTDLTNTQIHEISLLTEACCAHDSIRLSYPYEESGDNCRHYLLYEEDGTLAAILAMLPLDDKTAECSAFTHPAYRRQGCFSCLLEAAMEHFEDCDILFGVPESCRAAAEALSALGAELESREHQMELILSQAAFPAVSGTGSRATPADCAGLVLVSQSMTEGYDSGDCSCAPASFSQAGSGSCDEMTLSTAAWTLMKDNTPIGRCLITPVSGTCACLHQLEITGHLRQKGYGSCFLSLLLPRIASTGIQKIILQVSGDNEAAIALYKKTGFRITETLSFYCY